MSQTIHKRRQKICIVAERRRDREQNNRTLRRKRLAERNATCVRSFRSIRRLTRRDDNEIDYRVQSKRRSQQQTTATNILSREGERERATNKQTDRRMRTRPRRARATSRSPTCATTPPPVTAIHLLKVCCILNNLQIHRQASRNRCLPQTRRHHPWTKRD